MKRWGVFLVLAVFILLPLLLGARDPRAARQDFELREGKSWRFHSSAEGVVRSLYGAGTRTRIASEESVKGFLGDNAELFGITNVSELESTGVDIDSVSRTFSFRQVYAGLPVAGGEFAVQSDLQGHIVAVTGQFHRFTRGLSGRIVSVEEARKRVAHLRESDGGISPGTLMIVPMQGEPRPAWRFETESRELTGGSWVFYVDATSPSQVIRRFKTYVSFDGTGNVFLENPVVTPSMTSQAFHNMDGSTALQGKFTKIYDANFVNWFSFANRSSYTTASDPARMYNYPITDARFTEAMAYFHINRVHDRWRSFGFNKLNFPFPVVVNVVRPDGSGFDNAFYRRGSSYSFKTGAICMGSGKVFENFGHDGDVYDHEYGHAVLDRAKPGLLEALETNYPSAFHEGFGDISAAAVNGNSKIGEFGLRVKATKKFEGRELNNNNRFPQNVILKSYGRSEPHYTGLIVGGAWWDLQEQIGTDDAQKLLYRSLPILPNEMTFFDLRDALVTADERLFQGSHRAAIDTAFAGHGITGEDPGQHGQVQVSAIKTMLLDIETFKLKPKTSFKNGDYIIVVANYVGTGLTPAYNLIGNDMKIEGPSGPPIESYLSYDEAVNGSHAGTNGAWIAEIYPYNATPGTYTVTVQARLGGTSNLTESRKVKFKIQ